MSKNKIQVVELDTLLLAKKGNKKALMEVYISVYYMVVYLALLFNKVYREDLISEGTVAIFEALQDFDPKRKVKFSSYAYMRIKYKMLHFLAKNRFFYEEPDDSVVGEFLSKEYDILKKIHCNKLLENTAEKDRLMIVYRYGLEDGIFKTFEETGKFFKVSKQYVCKVEQAVFSKIRASLQI